LRKLREKGKEFCRDKERKMESLGEKKREGPPDSLFNLALVTGPFLELWLMGCLSQ
jgi:hypothetical protein